MFTGLVREIGRVVSLRARHGVTTVDLDAPRTAPGVARGDSLAVNGICLTVTETSARLIRADASVETRRVTTLARWKVHDRVHLEPALRVGDALGGHFVLGHVDGVGCVVGLERTHGIVRLTIGVDPSVCSRLLPKGSVAVDGVSLTLDAGPFADRFTVTLIPHTLRETRFASLRAGDRVNIEVDVLAKAAGTRGAGPRQDLTVAAILARGWSQAKGAG
jgi:riboflavin synthase